MAKTRLSNAEKNVLKHMRNGWWNLINKRTFYVIFGRENGENWAPPGPTGATIAKMMRKGLIDFEPKPGTIGRLVRTR
jgi:hypothetical protein